MTVLRSLLFAPGSHPRKVEKVFDAGADAVILDLEDAVAFSEKEAVRTDVVAALQTPRVCLGYIRINALETDFGFDDLEICTAPGVDGLILPKVESPAELEKADWAMAAFEKRRGLAVGQVDLIPILETGRGIAAAREICSAAPARVRRISFGAADYTRDMGMVWTPSEHACEAARAELVLASRIAGIEPPIDSVWARLDDETGLITSSKRVMEMGFQGKFCIHPKQIAPVHAAFTPSAEEVAHARSVVEAFEQAEAAGSASIQIDGQFVDYPVVASARRTLARAEAADSTVEAST
ncbi:MAG: CoA ester lyase [Pseudomonadota bacterium]